MSSGLNIEGEDRSIFQQSSLSDLAKEHVRNGDLAKLSDKLDQVSIATRQQPLTSKADAPQVISPTTTTTTLDPNKPVDIKALLEQPRQDAPVATPETPKVEVAPEVKNEAQEFLSSIGGEKHVKEATAFYDHFNKPLFEFNADSVLDAVLAKSPEQYDLMVGKVFETHGKQYLENSLRSMGLTKEDYSAFQQWREAGMPLGEQQVEEELDPEDPHYQELMDSRAYKKQIALQSKQNELQQEKQKEQLANQKKQEFEQWANQNAEIFERRSQKAAADVVGQLIEQRVLGSSPDEEKIKQLIIFGAEGFYNMNPQQSQEFDKAVKAIKYGDLNYAKSAEQKIHGSLRNHAVETAQFLVDLLSYKQKYENLQRGNAANVVNPKPSAFASAPTTGVVAQMSQQAQSANAKPFTKEANNVRLQALEANGAFNK